MTTQKITPKPRLAVYSSLYTLLAGIALFAILGVLQGAAIGFVASISVLAVVAWRDNSSLGQKTANAGSNVYRENPAWAIRLSAILACGGFVIVVVALAFVLGAIVGQQQLYQTWTNHKLNKLNTILESKEYAGLQADFSSAAQVYLTGTIKNTATRDALRDQLVVTFGTEEAERMLYCIDIAN